MPTDLRAKLFYPDPTKPAGLEYELPEDSKVTIEIFQESGKLVQSVFTQTSMKAGKQFLEFNKIGLAGGEYTIRILAYFENEEHRLTKKIFIEGSSDTPLLLTIE